jgi:hypothetical protein
MSDFSQRIRSGRRVDRLARFGVCILLVLICGCTAAVAGEAADASNYPNRAIHYVVPYPPGAFNDTLARIVSQKLQEAWGVSVVVDNRPGGGTLIGTEAVAKAPPDGYTLLGVAFPFGANPSIYKKLPYDTVKDFTPVIFAGLKDGDNSFFHVSFSHVVARGDRNPLFSWEDAVRRPHPYQQQAA